MPFSFNCLTCLRSDIGLRLMSFVAFILGVSARGHVVVGDKVIDFTFLGL